MDDAVQRIASAVGSQWTQLYVRLRLDYRGRYKIDSANAEVEPYESRLRKCALDTMANWRATQRGVGEREALRRLLSVLMQLKNMESLTEQLAASNGVALDDLSSSHSYSDTSPSLSASEDSSTPRGGHPPPSAPSWRVAGGGTAQGRRSWGAADSLGEEPYLLAALPESAPGQKHQAPANIPVSQQPLHHALSSDSGVGSITDVSLNQPINLQLKSHKFAILDVCQRLHPNNFHTICDHLHVPRDSVRQILQQETLTEEQYYRALMMWLGGRREGEEEEEEEVTFAQLCAVLSASNENIGVVCVKQRLRD